MYSQKNLNELISKLIRLISIEINLKGVYLFGSYAKGKAHEYSDIDLALVSDDFAGSRFFDKKKINKYLLKTTTDFQIHPFKTEDFTEDDPFVAEILRTGIRII
jgi:predicted nucleotidyltransferase